MTTATTYLTRREYAADQRERDARFDAAIQNLRGDFRQEIRTVNKSIDQLRRDIRHEIGAVNIRIGRVEEDVTVLKQDVSIIKDDMRLMAFEQRRNAAWFRNQLKKIPTMRIEPIPIWHPENGCLFPDNRSFPHSAKEFYALRRPHTSHRRQMLMELVLFYDVSWRGGLPGPQTRDQMRDELYKALADPDTVALVFDALEGVLGLVEDNFVTFLERARQREKQQKKRERKRDRSALEKQRQPLMPLEESTQSASSSSSPEEDDDEEDDDDLSAPAARRRRMMSAAEPSAAPALPQQGPSSTASTNAVSLPHRSAHDSSIPDTASVVWPGEVREGPALPTPSQLLQAASSTASTNNSGRRQPDQNEIEIPAGESLPSLKTSSKDST